MYMYIYMHFYKYLKEVYFCELKRSVVELIETMLLMFERTTSMCILSITLNAEIFCVFGTDIILYFKM